MQIKAFFRITVTTFTILFVIDLMPHTAAGQTEPAGADTVHVSPPTGDRTTDRASISQALELVPPGGTIEFAPGEYLMGGKGIRVQPSNVTLRGHREGTVLIGCPPGEQLALNVEDFFESCNGLYLTGGGQALIDLTFEEFSLAVAIYGPDYAESGETVNRDGGHVIEENVFRNVLSVRVISNADAPVVIRNNVFENVGHAAALSGRNIHVLGNRVSAWEPGRVPFSWPGVAIGLRPEGDAPCSDNRIEGNRIEGYYAEAIIIAVLPQDPAGAACTGNRLVRNVIDIRPLRLPAHAGDELADKLSLAPAIRLLNMQRAVALGTVEWPERWMPEGGWPTELMDGDVAGNFVEGNRIVGAIGIGIELVHASGNRVADNEIEVRPARTPEERAGLEWGGNLGPGLWLDRDNFDETNGSSIWLSPGSDENEIIGNQVSGPNQRR